MIYKEKIVELWESEASAGRLFLHDDITPELGMFMAAHLDRCERDKNINEVTIDICSLGGDIDVALQIADRVRSMQTPVTTMCSGRAYSGGLLVLAAGRKRRSLPNSWLLFHGLKGRVGWETSPRTLREAEHFVARDRMQCEYLAAVTRRDYDHWAGLVASSNDHYITAAEALAWGVIDEVVELFAEGEKL